MTSTESFHQTNADPSGRPETNGQAKRPARTAPEYKRSLLGKRRNRNLIAGQLHKMVESLRVTAQGEDAESAMAGAMAELLNDFVTELRHPDIPESR